MEKDPKADGPNRADREEDGWDCDNDPHQRCEVLYAVDEEVIFVEPSTCLDCRYLLRYGCGYICRSPRRLELYRREGV